MGRAPCSPSSTTSTAGSTTTCTTGGAARDARLAGDLRRPRTGIRVSPWVAARSVFGGDGRKGCRRYIRPHQPAGHDRAPLPAGRPARDGTRATRRPRTCPTRSRLRGGPVTEPRPFLPYWIAWTAGGGTLGPRTTVAAGGALSLRTGPGPGAPGPAGPAGVLPGGPARRDVPHPQPGRAGSTSPPSRTAASSSTSTSPGGTAAGDAQVGHAGPGAPRPPRAVHRAVSRLPRARPAPRRGPDGPVGGGTGSRADFGEPALLADHKSAAAPHRHAPPALVRVR